jgi:hypothetical protein
LQLLQEGKMQLMVGRRGSGTDIVCQIVAQELELLAHLEVQSSLAIGSILHHTKMPELVVCSVPIY